MTTGNGSRSLSAVVYIVTTTHDLLSVALARMTTMHAACLVPSYSRARRGLTDDRDDGQAMSTRSLIGRESG